MKSNMGKTDRMFRMFGGAAVVVTGAFLHSWLALLGVALMFTAAIGFCPLYVPFKKAVGKEEACCGTCGCRNQPVVQ